mgnify:CR=1 FL=1
MIVLTTTTAEQTFGIIPREYVTDATICIRDESTNDENCVLTSGSFWNTYNVIFRDKIFCTDQTIDQETNNYYDVNQGQYIQNTSGNNDYIIF